MQAAATTPVSRRVDFDLVTAQCNAVMNVRNVVVSGQAGKAATSSYPERQKWGAWLDGRKGLGRRTTELLYRG
jgi:hypothetical protein